MDNHDTWISSSHKHGNLAARFGADALAAATTAAIVSPVVTMIDSTIIMKASGNNTFSSCLRQFVRPISSLPYRLLFSRPSRLVFTVYCGTYLTANCLDTLTSFWNNQPAETVTANMPKFVATAVVATGLTVYKDSRLVQILGNQRRSTAVPLASYCLFTLRDAITIFASFNLPTMIAPKLSGMIETEAGRVKTAQFLLPAAIQFITTPIHLLGLDMYNRRAAVAFHQRAELVGRDMRTAIPARIVRIVPAFSVGGVVNLTMRRRLMQQIDTGT